jgi:hypothetical protein
MFHVHPILGQRVYVLLQDIHAAPGVFVDSERGLATTLLVGRCVVCGLVYIPIAAIQRHDDATSTIPITTHPSQYSLWGDQDEQ